MPSVSVTPAQFGLTWGAVSTTPARVSVGALALRMTMGAVSAGPGYGITTEITAPRLDRLHASEQLLHTNMTPSRRFMGIWQKQAESIETAFEALTSQVVDLSALVLQIQAAQAQAQAARDAAEAVEARTSLAQSYTSPPSVVTYANDGTATIIAHDRVYGNGVVKAVNAGSVTGLSGDVTIYYNDAGREGGPVTYLGTSSPISQEGTVHIVGQGTVPAAGQVPTSGSGPSAPGYTPPPGEREPYSTL